MEMKIQHLIRDLRTDRDISQEELASVLDVSTNYISLIENGKKRPGLPFLKKFSKKYDVPMLLLMQDIVPQGTNKREKDLQKRVERLLEELATEFLRSNSGLRKRES